jgi:hypothetical protein
MQQNYFPVPYIYTWNKKYWGILGFIFCFNDFRSDYLGEYEAKCETVLAC